MSYREKIKSRVLLGPLACAAMMFCASCGSQQAAQPAGPQAATPAATIATDCAVPASALPPGETRVYIALRGGVDGSGQSADDARDGSTATAFDTILRCYAEGCASHAIPRTENLIVCLGPGTFPTMGNYDALVDHPHLTAQGFTVGKGWKIHGQGTEITTVQLSAFLAITDPSNPQGLPVGTGDNVVFSTTSHQVSGVEISGMTIDANYPALKQLADANGILALNLEAIHLWSGQGGNWVHNVNIINAAGEIGLISEGFETSAVLINSGLANSKPTDSSGNLVENVTMSQFGGGACMAIAIGNSVAEVRNNRVTGYQIGYAGWTMGPVRFHDNIAQDTIYGFNIDSLSNDGFSIESNQIAVSRGYGIVIGGGGVYTNIRIADNTIHIRDPLTTGLLLQGNVTNSTITGNTFAADSSAAGAYGIRNYSANTTTAGPNSNNVYQSNQIDSAVRVIFESPSALTLNCSFGNRDEHGNPRNDLPDTAPVPCVP